MAVDVKYTHIALVLDRSGSMHHLRDDVIGGTNKFLDDQVEVEGVPDARATVSIHRFDTEYETIAENEPLTYESTRLNRDNYQPRGGTALLDAIGDTIKNTGRFLAGLPEDERPGSVLIVINTDGEENSSTKYTKPQVIEMIKEQRDKYNWQFIYLGANQDAIAVGDSFGLSYGTSINFNATAFGYNVMASGTSCAVMGYRTMRSCSAPQDRLDLEFSDELRSDIENAV